MAVAAAMIDSREPDWIQQIELDGAPKIVTALEFGDAMLTTSEGDLILVERKTPTDLLGSIRDNRLFTQAAGIRKQTQWAYLVITGTLTMHGDKVVADGRKTGWGWNAVQGALLTVQEGGVGIIYVDSDADYEATLKVLCNRERNKERVIEHKVDSRVMSTGEILLSSLPGIGIDRAQKLLRQFDNKPAAALAWLTWLHNGDHFDIEGIGVGIKRTVRTALGLEDGQEFDLVSLPPTPTP